MPPKHKSNVFTPYEKEVVSDLVQERINIVENKCNNALNISKKDGAWHEITTEFNSR